MHGREYRPDTCRLLHSAWDPTTGETICLQLSLFLWFIIIIIIMQHLTRHVSVIRMMNRMCGDHVDLRVAVSVTRSSAIAE